jgi:long-chain acyl-CoA synthetase
LYLITIIRNQSVDRTIIPHKAECVFSKRKEKGRSAPAAAAEAAVAEGRIAGKYQLSNVRVPNTAIIQRSRVPGIIVGADVKVDKAAAKAHGVEVARSQRQGRNSARAVGTITRSEVMMQAPRSYPARETQPDDPAVLIYTSGTTGNPKGATLTHRNMHFQVNTIVRSLIDYSVDDRVNGVLPMYHVFGLANSLVTAVTAGACTVLVPHYSPHNLLRAIAEEKATILTAVPSMYMHLLCVVMRSGSWRVTA